jgi:hypothetical protein
MQKTYGKRERISYQPLGLVDVTVRPIVVHRHLALSIEPIPL